MFLYTIDLGIGPNPEGLPRPFYVPSAEGRPAFSLFEFSYLWLLEVSLWVSSVWGWWFSFSTLLIGLWVKFNFGGRFYCLAPRTFKDCGYYDKTDYLLLIQIFKSSKDILSLSSTSRHFLIKSFVGYEIFKVYLNLTGILVILSMSYFSVLHYHGV